MFRTITYKVVVLAMLALLPLLGYAGFKEPPGSAKKEHLIGPATMGTATITQVGADARLSFSGSCKGKPVSVVGNFLNTNVALLTADDLEDLRPGQTDLAGDCYKILADLIVSNVITFANNGTTAVADVVVLAVVPAK